MPTPPIPRRLSSFSGRASLGRRISTLSVVEQGQAEDVSSEDQVVAEEIDEIKRYEDFTTIDWVRDAAREQQRRKAQKLLNLDSAGNDGWKRRLWESYDAGQAWIVVSLVGMAIGLIAACLNIITEWLSDIKLGYCTTAFYLNESFCCWGAEEGRCTIAISSRSKADCNCRLQGMASLEFAYCCKLPSVYPLLGMLSIPSFSALPHLTTCRPPLPSLPLDLSSHSRPMLLALVSLRSSASSLASS